MTAKTTFGLVLFCAVISSVHGACPSTVKSAADCVGKSSFDKLNQGDPSYYCEEGAKLAAAAQNCLRDCNFNEQDSELQKQKDTINQFCAKKYPSCPKVTDTFVAQTRCYDPYGGLDAVISDIKRQFHEGGTIECNELYWGRYCQRTQNCTFNQNLDQYILQSNSDIALGLAICGSETIKEYIPWLDKTINCNANVHSVIASKCNIACPLANAKDPQTICGLLESQAKCLEEQSNGCTDTARDYALPRFNTYAIANKYLGCKIQYNGIEVRTAGRDVDYIDAINSCTCTFAGIVPNIDIFGRLKSLFNRDLPLKDFCDTSANEDSKLTACKIKFLAYATPQHKLLLRTEDSSIEKTAKFASEIGAFPADSFGMAYLYNWLPASCASVPWTEQICVADADKPVITSVTDTSRTTPAGQTPAAVTGPNNGQSSKKDDNFNYSTAGPMLMPAALLIFVSFLSTLIMK